MKRFTILVIILILSIILVGCDNDIKNNQLGDAEPLNAFETNVGEQEKSEISLGVHDPDELVFSSLEDFLLAYQALQLGENITDYVERWFGELSGSTLESVTKGTSFASLKTLHLPVGIPNDYEIGKILVREGFLEIAFFHIDDMVSRDSMWNAERERRHFMFMILLWDYDETTLFSDMVGEFGAYKENLIDGKYLFREPNEFDWVIDGARFILYTPLRQLNERNESVSAIEIDGVSLNNPHELVVFTETRTVSLTDGLEVIALIREVRGGNQNQIEIKNQDESHDQSESGDGIEQDGQ